MSGNQIVQKLWNYCNALRDDGMSYGHYVEQLTYLLFFKILLDNHVEQAAQLRPARQDLAQTKRARRSRGA